MLEEIHGDAGGGAELEAVVLVGFSKNDWLTSVGEVGWKTRSFVAKNEGIRSFCIEEILGRLAFCI